MDSEKNNYKILANSKMAKYCLERFIDNPEQLKWFHLRPTSCGVTLVSTHPERAMRGIQKIPKSRIGEMLDLAANVTSANKIDWSKLYYKTSGCNKREFKDLYDGKKTKKEREFAFQALLINEIINCNENIEKNLEVEELFFLGSEVVYQYGTTQGAKKIDIIAHDNKGKILFMELKSLKPGEKLDKTLQSAACKQVNEYINEYSNNKDFYNLLLEYPALYPVCNIVEFVGWVIINYENNDKISLLSYKKCQSTPNNRLLHD